MEEIKEILKIVTKTRLKHKNALILDQPGSQKNLDIYSQFVNKLKKGEISNNKEGSSFLKIDSQNIKYRVFKFRLREKLLNSLFFLDLERRKSSPLVKAQYNCARNMQLIKILLLFGGRQIADIITRKTILIALEYKLTDVVAFCALELRYIASMKGKLADFDYYNNLYEEYSEIHKAEARAQGYLEKIRLQYIKSTSIKSEIATEALTKAKEVNKNRKKYKTHNLNFNYFRLLSLGQFISNDFLAAVKTWNLYEKYISSPQFEGNKSRFAEIAINKMVCYLHLKDFENAEKCAEKSKNFTPEGTDNWFFYAEHTFILAMHSAKYEKAEEILNEIISHPRFALLPESRKEKWEVFRPYWFYAMKYLKNKGIINYLPSNINWKKLVKSTPIFSKDKQGLNIAILLIQIMYLVENREAKKIIEKTEALNKYSSRYLKKDSSVRSNYFIKMVQAMEKSDFNYQKTKEATITMAKFLKRVDKQNYSFIVQTPVKLTTPRRTKLTTCAGPN